ncbi:MAG: DMT family transporter [Phycisphaerae bacterium]|nr:DMT family transporter [Phycisphaerae bacterium]
MIWRVLLLVFGVYCCATAVIMIKACTVPPVLLSAYRLLGAGVLLLPLFVRDYRRHTGELDSPERRRFLRRELRRTILPGVLLAVHFISWIIGARLTPAANSALIVNMVPVVMPFILFALLRERLTRGEFLGTGLAIAGLAALGFSDFHIRPEHLLGDVVCFGSMLFFAVYLALGRRNRHAASIWLYLVPLYLLGGVLCLIAGLILETPPGMKAGFDGLMTLGLILVPTILGHSILNYSMKHMRGQIVSLTNLGQFVFAGVMAFFWRGEIPAHTFYLAGVLIVAGAAVALKSQSQPQPPAPEAP